MTNNHNNSENPNPTKPPHDRVKKAKRQAKRQIDSVEGVTDNAILEPPPETDVQNDFIDARLAEGEQPSTGSATPPPAEVESAKCPDEEDVEVDVDWEQAPEGAEESTQPFSTDASISPPDVRMSPDANLGVLPLPGGPGSHPAPIDPRQAPLWHALLAEYEREIAAIGEDPTAAPLLYESGKIWEEKLNQPRNSWNCYNKAFQLQPNLILNIRAAGRLASQVGNWNAAVQILESEIETTKDPEVKAHLYHRRGLILEEKLGRVEEARASYDRAIALAPDNVEILRQLERLVISLGDWRAVLDVRSKLIELIQDTLVIVQLLLSCARIHQIYFQDNAEAESRYRRVLEIEPGNLAALGALRYLYTEGKRYEALLEILQEEARVTADPAGAAWLHYQAAQLLREQLGEEDRALKALEQALALSPGNHMVLAEMANIHENLARWQELVKVFEQQAQVISDRQELVSLFFKLGNIWEEKLFNEDRSVVHYRKVVELNPNYLPALQALGKIYYRKGQWDELVQMYEVEIRATQDPKTKAVKLYKLAEILEERSNRDEDAIQKFEKCLELSPGYLPALKALGRLYAKYNRWESLVSMYENEMKITQDLDQSVFLLDKIGTLWEDKLNNTDKAVETYQRLLQISPNYLPAVRTLGKLYVRAGYWEDMIRINELEAQLVNDQKQVVSLLHRNGEIYEEKLNHKDQAIETYKKVLALAPAYLPALQSLGRLYFIKGRWEDLIAMHRQEIEVTQNEDQQITLLYKIGQLYEEKLVQEDKAIIAYQEVLRIHPTDFPAMKALARIYTNKRDWGNLIEICELESTALEDPQQKALSLFRVAEIWENHIERPDQAVETLQRILHVVPDHAPTIRSLVRLYTRNQNWRKLLAIYERELEHPIHDARQVEIYSHMSEIYATQANDLARAAECHEKILRIQADHLPSLEALERIYLSQRNYSALVRIYESLAQRTADTQLQLSLQSQIADLKENRLQPPQNASENHLRILALNPNHPEAVRSLDILYRRFGTWQGLRVLYEQWLARAQSPDEALDLCMRVADLAETRLQLPEVAAHYYQEALRIAPDHLPAIKAMKRISLARNDHHTMIGLLEREGQVTRDPHQAITTLLQAAQIYRDRFNDPQRAIDCLLRVLDRDPREVQSFSQLETLFIQQNDWERLAILYRNRLQVTEDNRFRVELQLKLGSLLRERLKHPEEAMESYRKVLEINPLNLQALVVLADLAFEGEDWDTSIELSTRVLELTNEPRQVVSCSYRLGLVYQEKKPDLEKAFQYFMKVLELAPSDIPTLQRLKSIHLARQQWNNAIQVLSRLVEVDREPGHLVEHQLEQAGIYETGLDDPEQAMAAYRRVQELDPSNLSVIQELGELYQRLERPQELVDSYHAFIHLLPPERAHEAIPLHLKMGELFSEGLNNPDKAILEYKRVVEVSPQHTQAHEALSQLYGRTGLYYANAIDEHRKLLQINPFRIESYRELRRIFKEQRAFDKVLCTCGVLHFLRAADQDEEFFFGENRNKVPEHSTEQLSPDEIESFLVHPDQRMVIREILKLVGGQLTRLYPPNLERHGVGKGSRAHPDDPLRKLCDGMVANLGEVEYELYRSNQPTHLVAIENTTPPALIVGEGLAKRTVVKEQRFALGRAIMRIRHGSFLASWLGPRELARLTAAVIQPHYPNCPAATFASESLDELTKRFAKAVPRKIRKVLEELIHDRALELAQVPDYHAYLNGVEQSANRFGLLMCNDLPQAMMHLIREIPELSSRRLNTTTEIISALSSHANVCELLRFAVSEDYFRMRSRLKFSIVT